MNRSIALLLVCAFAAVGVALVRCSGTASASPNPPQQARNRNESPGGPGARPGTKSIDHGFGIRRCHFGLVAASCRTAVRRHRALGVLHRDCQHKMTFVGGARFHEYVDAASATPIDLSAAQLAWGSRWMTRRSTRRSTALTP